MLAGATDEQVRAGAAYGYHLGMAFQMVDDLLDVVGDAAALGKNTGMDAALGKLTWVALRGVEETRRDAAEHIRLACGALKCFGAAGGPLRTLAEETLKRVS